MSAPEKCGCDFAGNVTRREGPPGAPGIPGPPGTSGYPTSYIENANLSYTAASQLTISAGSARDTTDSEDINLLAPQIVDLNVAGANGLDAGAKAANTWYYIHIIFDNVGMGVAGLISLSAAAPALPAPYTHFRRIGVGKTNGASNWYSFYQVGNGAWRTYHWDVAWTTTQVLAFGQSTPFVPLSLAAWVPPVSMFVELGVSVDSTPASPGPFGCRLRPTGSVVTDPVWKVYAPNLQAKSPESNVQMPCSQSQSIDWRSEATPFVGFEDEVYIWVVGFEDEL